MKYEDVHCGFETADEAAVFKATKREVRLTQLWMIQGNLDRYESSRGFGPRVSEANLMAVVAGLLSTAALIVLASLGFKVAAWQWAAPLTIAIVAYAWVHARRRASQNWDELIARQLADYEPTDIAAYRLLEERVRKSGSFMPEWLAEWLAAERAAILRSK